jgi:ribosomal protein L24E
MKSKMCHNCLKIFYKKDYMKKQWGLFVEISDHHFSLKKYCSDKCKSSAKSKRNPRKEYHKNWREENKDKIDKYVSLQKDNRNKASKRYYYKKTSF